MTPLPRSPLLLATLLAIALPIACEQPPDLTVEGENLLPVRIAQSSDGRFHVSDTGSGSVFIYDEELRLEEELKGLGRPLGVAVDSHRQIYVGDDTEDAVLLHNRRGVRLRSIGAGAIRMPNDLAIGPSNRLFVADSLSDAIWVYTSDGELLGRIGSSGSGPGQLSFPVAVAVAMRDGSPEVYVGDQRNARIQVFAPDGTFLRAFGSKVPNFGSDWQGRFVTIQGLAVDAEGHLHVLDSYMHVVQVFDPGPGLSEADRFLRYYGVHGSGPGELNLPLDLVISRSGETVVTNSGNHTVETISQEAGS